MFIFRQSDQVHSYIQSLINRNRTIAFVPTMGALHEGHMALIEQAKSKAEIVVCSIFVNPTQFNDPKDYRHYPNRAMEDKRMLEAKNCDVLFMPEVEEVYPRGEENYRLNIEMGSLVRLWEGAHRPGHFAGMMQVVKRLLDLIPAEFLVMGQKDYQQLAIVRRMIEELDISTELVGVPIVREKDGLASSSRNLRIDPDLRPQANTIYHCLKLAKKNWPVKTVQEIEREAVENLVNHGLRPEYFSLVNGTTLEPIHEKDPAESVVALVAAWLGKVRLIDNMIIKN